jgi:hypothetical protein
MQAAKRAGFNGNPAGTFSPGTFSSIQRGMPLKTWNTEHFRSTTDLVCPNATNPRAAPVYIPG